MQFYRMSRYQKNKIKIKFSMTTSNYKLDIGYALVDTDIINNKKNIISTEAITFFNSISDINHITQNTDICKHLMCDQFAVILCSTDFSFGRISKLIS